MIYNELIIIKFCNMEKNTYKYISLRQKEEFEDIQNIKNREEENTSPKNADCSFELIGYEEIEE